jgi:2'-5' RNA ligase
MESVRAFVAIELPSSVKSALSQLQDNLKRSEHASVKWVNTGSIHLTLKFLGNIATETIPELTKVLSEAARGITPFHLELGEMGVFPNLRAPRVVWVGIRGEIATLSVLQENIESALIPLGFPPESRAFSPHLTLGRVREKASPGERRSLGQAVASSKVASMEPFPVDSVSLMRSTLTREGAVYSRLYSVALHKVEQEQ